MISYLLQLTLCWAILFTGYSLFLKKETFFLYNRWYLLLGLVLGILIPLVDWSALFIHQPDSMGHIYITPVQSQVQQLEIYVSATHEQSWRPGWLFAIYAVGLLMTGTRMIKGLYDIRSLRTGAKNIQRMNGYNLVLTQKIHMPFSFLKSVYWSEELYRESAEKDKILAHEVQHVNAWHTLDVLFLEALCIIFWFHPLVYLYRKELRKVHEYEADAAACILGNKKEYGRLLLNQAQSGLQLALANHFFYSQLKDRIIMITKKPSHRYARYKYLVVLPLVCLVALLFSFSPKENNIENPFSELFPSDTILPPKEISVMEMKEDGEKKLMDHIALNIKYPADARSKIVQGMVTAFFYIDENGTIDQIKVHEDPGAGLGEEVIRVLKSSPQLKEKSIGHHDLSIDFILQGDEIQKEKRSNSADFVVVGYAENQPSATSLSKKEINSKDALIVINGKMENKDEGAKSLKGIEPSSIKSIHVIKGDEAIKSYGDEGKNGVIRVRTKSSGTDKALIVIDGVAQEKEQGKKAMKDLNPNSIQAINVLKDQTAIEKYGESAKDGVIEVFTKTMNPNTANSFKGTVTIRQKEVTIESQNEEKADPLIILDGEIMGRSREDITNTISPSSIESIHVLKGQKAIEKYGDQGQDGVIEIISKVPQKLLEQPKLNLSQLNIYPNPVQHQLNIHLEGQEGDYHLEIVNISGVSQRIKTLYNPGTSNIDMDTNELKAGMYYLIITSGNHVTTKAFVKQ